MGMTFAELALVVLIVSIVVALALPQYIRAVESTKAEEAMVSLEQIRHGEVIYRGAENSYWPLGAAENDITTINTQLNLSLDGRTQRNWDYSVIAPTKTTFDATASRRAGSSTYNGKTITIDQTGTIDDSNWPLPLP